MGSSSVSMETAVIMHNIQRIVKVHAALAKMSSTLRSTRARTRGGHVGVCTKRTNTSEVKMPLKLHVCFFFIFLLKENECLKKEILEKNSCIEKQNSKISELITQNQR